VRTVHHVDDFRSPSLIACQERSIAAPDRVLVVSTPWIARLRDEFGVEAELVPNGVDLERFHPPRDAGERAAARDAAGLGAELAILTVGGIEPRKGSLTLLRAFAAARAALPERRPVLLVAGGATLFDHRDEIDRFHALREDLDLDGSVRVLGPVTDAGARAPLPRGRRLRPALDEGGLRARGPRGAGRRRARRRLRPRRLPDLPGRRRQRAHGPDRRPRRPGRRAGARGARPELAARLRDGGRVVAARHGWDAAAAAHEAAYARFLGR
jgi:glycosyltransferase involved in cell wall biosynthesis